VTNGVCELTEPTVHQRAVATTPSIGRTIAVFAESPTFTDVADPGTATGYGRTMSQIYSNGDQFEALFTRMFDQIGTDDPDGMDELVEQQMVIRFRLRKPDVELWVDGRSKPVQTSFGAQQLDATLTADLTANSMHELLLGTLPLGRAILFRKLKVKGSKSKAMKLESLLHAMQEVYPALTEEMLPNA